MKKLPHQLIFISQINRDGSGTSPISEDYQKSLLENPLMNKEYLELHCLSSSEETYIAHGFNSFVVKLKENLLTEKYNAALEILNQKIDFSEDGIIERSNAIEAMKSFAEKFSRFKDLNYKTISVEQNLYCEKQVFKKWSESTSDRKSLINSCKTVLQLIEIFNIMRYEQ